MTNLTTPMLVESFLDLNCVDDTPQARVREVLFSACAKIAAAAEIWGFSWFYVLSSTNGSRYLASLKAKMCSTNNSHATTGSPFSTALDETRRFMPDQLPAHLDELHLILYLTGPKREYGRSDLFSQAIQLGARNARLLPVPADCIAATPTNQRHTVAGLELSASVSALAHGLLRFEGVEYFAQVAQALSALLDLSSKYSRQLLIIENIRYRTEYLRDRPDVLLAAEEGAKRLAQNYGSLILARPSKPIIGLLESLQRVISHSPCLLHSGLQLPIHWLCNNLALRFGQELLLLFALEYSPRRAQCL